MQRRTFLKSGLCAGATATLVAHTSALRDAAADSASHESLLAGSPVVFGPDSAALTVVQGVRGAATGFLELALGDEPFQRVDAETAGLLPYDPHVLKFRLPPLPAGQTLRYRIVARPIDFQTAYKILPGEPVTSETYACRLLDPSADETQFVVWNDTHENQTTLDMLERATAALEPDFLLWNGDQTNDIYDVSKLSAQVLSPGGLTIAARWPLAYARGNHDVRGPAARHLPEFTGTPDDRFYYGFRSGPVAVLVLDTGEDKPDDHPVFGGLAAFETMRRRQREWLARVVRQAWFREAPFRLLFCHIPLWWIDEVSDPGHWRFSKVCREAWLPQLVEAGVQLVISGHTHEHAWMPPTAERPIGQLIGGGPKPQHATILEGTATRHKLQLVMKKLDGAELHRVTFEA
ncbi:MAG: metallophosphoesterase [Pirellulales bacterium]|nr:metallophosphoesterase [Pirellulales bacterium]